MIKINLHNSKYITSLKSETGPSLLDILRKNKINVYAPCGGKGTCGKCRVRILNEGFVLSCTYFPTKDIDIVLPEKEEAQILVSQTEYLEEYPLDIQSQPNNKTYHYGIAIDIGTTTIVMYFTDLENGNIKIIKSFLNPQHSFGSDVIARINHCQENENGLQTQQKIIIDAINKEIGVFCKQLEITETTITRIAISGNTTMLHILCGVNPISIALAPFTPKFTDKQTKKGKDTLFKMNPNGALVTLPCISGYVGADIVAGLAVLKPSYKNYLFLDIGTNGEMALITGNNLYTCATAAGPAFEGANLACGMGAVKGALSIFENPENYQVIGDVPATGICGSGIVDIIAWLLQNGYIDQTGYMGKNYPIPHTDNVYVSQQDIREIQLAKSAIYSGIKIMLKHAGLAYINVDALFLAGGFGNYINIESAMQIGLLPAEMKGKIYAIGNSAGIGTLQYLKSQNFAAKAEEIRTKAQYIELSEDDDFTLEFAMNMDFIDL